MLLGGLCCRSPADKLATVWFAARVHWDFVSIVLYGLGILLDTPAVIVLLIDPGQRLGFVLLGAGSASLAIASLRLLFRAAR